MKHIYLSIDDLVDGFSIVDGKVKISDNYLSSAQLDAKFQPIGTYATKDELLDTNDKIDLLSDVYQPLGNYVTTEFADENYLTNASLQSYVVRTELEEYATKEYVNEALSGFEGGTGGTGEGFNGNFTGNSKFTGDMIITGELNVPLIYDAIGTRQISVADIVTNEDLNTILPGLGGGGSEYVLPVATDAILGGVKIGSGIQVDSEGVISVSAQGGGSDYVLPVATKTTLGGVIAGDNINIDATGKISVTIPESSGGEYTLPTASDTVLGGIKIGEGLSIDGNGVVSASGSAESYTLPNASATVLGGVKVGTGLAINASGVLSSTVSEFDGTYDGQMSVVGDLVVSGSIYHKGEIIQQEPGLEYKEGTVKALFEHGQMIIGTPKTTGEIVYQEDGTFSDDDGGYSGKLTPEGYLDLSVQNKIKTSLGGCGIINNNCFAYVEIIGKIGTANSIFAPMVRTDLATGTGQNSFLGTRNPTTTNAIGTAMTSGLNRIVFAPTSSGNGSIYVNGMLVSGSNMLARASGSTDVDLFMAYCWAAGGTGLLKKCAWISYSEYEFNGDDDGILISKEGFRDTPAPVLMSLRAETELSILKRRVDELYSIIDNMR